MLWTMQTDSLYCETFKLHYSNSHSSQYSVVQTYLKMMVPVTDCSLVHFQQPSESWSPPDDKCITYICEKVNNTIVTTKHETTCPEFNPEDCIPVSII